MSKEAVEKQFFSRATTASDGYLKELEPTLRQASKIRGALPDEDAATKGDIPGTPQPGKKDETPSRRNEYTQRDRVVVGGTSHGNAIARQTISTRSSPEKCWTLPNPE
jgi:hypothetical protein